MERRGGGRDAPVQSGDGTQGGGQSGTQGGTQRFREEYRTRAAELDEREAEYTQPTNTMLATQVEAFNELFKMSRKEGEAHETARNAAIDSRCILKASRLGTMQSSNLNQSTPLEFMRAIKLKFGNISAETLEGMTDAQKDTASVAINWDALADFAHDMSNAAPAWDSPWSASLVAIVGKERKAREKRVKDVLEAEVRPKELTATSVNTETEMTQKRRCDAMRATIERAEKDAAANGGNGLNFFHLVLNPEEAVGFGQTIENMFDFSFHLKEGNVRIDIADGEPMVRFTRPPSAEAYREGLSKVQNILKLDYPTWQQLRKRYGAQRMLPTRRSAAAADASGSNRGDKRARK
ncbi:hypothetical protein KFE25_013000 [Diacronema lutheri]|uniref:Non-structural maintenance of chromosomes element 4 n=1 Tax=Diacronema lutheri TaxID=2081491 RepID=A0A8J5XEP8_DIALT|nr:hypothetical protein KFE25_013000 [Diacronema lutheri]